MSRRRDLSTDISTDEKINELSDFAALVYTWSIPHANEDCSLRPRSAKEVRMLIVPGRDRSVEEVAAAMDEIFALKLWLRDDDGSIYFPPDSFYKYQNKIAADRRRVAKPARIAAEPHETPQNPAEPREIPKNPVSSSSSSSVSSSFSSPAQSAGSCARARETVVMDTGNRHPKSFISEEMWERWQKAWREIGKPIGIYQAESLWLELKKLRDAGNDPAQVVEQTIAFGYRKLLPVINIAGPPGSEQRALTADELRERAKERAARKATA